MNNQNTGKISAVAGFVCFPGGEAISSSFLFFTALTSINKASKKLYRVTNIRQGFCLLGIKFVNYSAGKLNHWNLSAFAKNKPLFLT
jgi:hypothetical protein